MLGKESKRARDVMLAFGESLGTAHMGRIESRLDMTPENTRDHPENYALKSDFADFLTPDAVGSLQTELVNAMRIADGEKSLESAFEFLGCNKTPWQNIAAFLNSPVHKVFESDYTDLLSPDIAAGRDARRSCGPLLEAPAPGKSLFFEFFVDGTPGKMHQHVQVRRARGWGFEMGPTAEGTGEKSSLRHTPPPALFRAQKPLLPNVALVARVHSRTKKLGVQLLPTSEAFSRETGAAARKLLGFNVGGVFNHDPKHLADLSRQWYAGQEHGTQSRIALNGFQTALVVGSAGAAAAQAIALQSALAAGTGLGGWEVASLVTRLGAAGFGLANEIVDLTQLRDSLEMMDHNERRKALDVSLLVLTAAGNGFAATNLALHSMPVLNAAYRVYFDSSALIQAARQGGHTSVTQLNIKELLALDFATNRVLETEWNAVQAALERAQTFNAAGIAQANALNDGLFLRIANAYKTVVSNFDSFAGFVTKMNSAPQGIKPSHYDCDGLSTRIRSGDFRWQGCVNWMKYRQELLQAKLPAGFSAAGLRKAMDDCTQAKGTQCQKRQFYCLTTLWDDAFNACIASGNPGCILEVCKTPPSFSTP